MDPQKNLWTTGGSMDHQLGTIALGAPHYKAHLHFLIELSILNALHGPKNMVR